MVRNITLNERRWGDLDVRKRIVISYKLGKTKKNEGERDSAYVPGYHEGIVSPDIATTNTPINRYENDSYRKKRNGWNRVEELCKNCG